MAAAVEEAAGRLGATRPTAVNLRWALGRVAARVAAAGSDEAARDVTLAEARAIHEEQHDADARMAELGAALFPDGSSVLTLCNTGPLATAGGGTALGVIVEAWRRGRLAEVLACETRPRLQGARLTAWELQQHDVPFRLIVEGAAASLMAAGRVDAVDTTEDAADRRVRTPAIGVTAPTATREQDRHLHAGRGRRPPPRHPVLTSSLDPSRHPRPPHSPDGASIPIEERDEGEVLRCPGRRGPRRGPLASGEHCPGVRGVTPADSHLAS